MSIDREESLFLTVSEDHRPRKYPEFICMMSDPFEKIGGMNQVYEGVILGGGDKLFGLDELNLWRRRHRYAAFDACAAPHCPYVPGVRGAAETVPCAPGN